MEIQGLSKEEMIIHYKLPEKIAWVWLDEKNYCPDRYGPAVRIPTERRVETIIREIYIIRRNFNITTRALNPQTVQLKYDLNNRLCHVPQKNHRNIIDLAYKLYRWIVIKTRNKSTEM